MEFHRMRGLQLLAAEYIMVSACHLLGFTHGHTGFTVFITAFAFTLMVGPVITFTDDEE